MDKENKDKNAHLRKQDHIDLSFQAQINSNALDPRFYYEPMLAGHPKSGLDIGLTFLRKRMEAPIWVSSMTGGAQYAHKINHNLARVVNEFGLGMGLGSCRNLLYDDKHLADFDVRELIGDRLLYANLGIAQIEHEIKNGGLHKIESLLQKLQVDGLIIHVNPLQEWIQPEGDFIQYPPIETIKRFIDKKPNISVIIKEVGQGFGPNSMEELLQLPIDAIDFGAAGGTNFAKLEMLRNDKEKQAIIEPLARLGHTAEEMLSFVHAALAKNNNKGKLGLIISGGIKNYLDGYYFVNKSSLPAIYGQASTFLKHAKGEYATLRDFVSSQTEGYQLAHSLLSIKR